MVGVRASLTATGPPAGWGGGHRSDPRSPCPERRGWRGLHAQQPARGQMLHGALHLFFNALVLLLIVLFSCYILFCTGAVITACSILWYGDAGPCSALVNQGANILALRPLQCCRVGPGQNQDGELVVAAGGWRQCVHHSQAILQHTLVKVRVSVLFGIRGTCGVPCRHTPSTMVALNMMSRSPPTARTQGRGGIGREEGVAGAAAEDGDAHAMAFRASLRVKAGSHLRHGDGGEHLGLHAQLLQLVGDGQRARSSRSPAFRSCRPGCAPSFRWAAAPEVAAAHHVPICTPRS